ncbi:uncharacterized protein TrAtP1_002046 [Trichoderma atroviride]|uniref:uncharacterized protein n=1 Tax=Hypocrea atroviridis TaxID=63577 RepID=UPI00332E73F4|nr:hypothetical protein TrAtP1_002046 [Trichoderma atroviride]
MKHTSFFLETPSLLERRTDAGNDGIGAVSESGRESSPYGISSVIEQLVHYLWHHVACRYRGGIVEFMMDMHPSRCRAKAAGLAACQPQGVGCMYFERISSPYLFCCEETGCYATRRSVTSFASCDIGCTDWGIIAIKVQSTDEHYQSK